MESVKTIRRFPGGTITAPPSKSIAHRALICGGLAAIGGAGGSVLHNIGHSMDMAATIDGMGVLGASYSEGGGACHVAAAPPPSPGETPMIDCRESGSTLRFLLPLAALNGREIGFVGRGRLMERPLEVYESLFARAGVTLRRDGGMLLVRGGLQGGTYGLAGHISSQFISGLLLALPLAEDDSILRLETPLESRQYVDLTLDAMKLFGVNADISPSGDEYRIRGGQRYTAAHTTVEGDFSQAAFFLAAAALGRDIRVAGLNPDSRQGDKAILDILSRMGAPPVYTQGGYTVPPNPLRAVEVDLRDIPDLAPPVAVLCALARGESLLYNAGRLRLKESDRLRAIASELTKLGAVVTEEPDSLRIQGKPKLRGGAVQGWNDHRIAMMCALAALRCTSPVSLTGWESVEKSYPGFWDDFEKEAGSVSGA